MQENFVATSEGFDIDSPSYSAINASWKLHEPELSKLYFELYMDHPHQADAFLKLKHIILNACVQRPSALKEKDDQKAIHDKWFLTNELVGMSLYVDRFCGNLNGLKDHLEYLHNLGINFLHLMPLFKSPPLESDGGYAVSDFRMVDEKFGNLKDLKNLISELQNRDFYLMLDIVLNHTSHHHEWAMRAKAGDPYYQDYFYMYDDQEIPNQFEKTMPEIFPESSPGNFTYIPECKKWVMTVFHQYQWDLNFSNPYVLVEMIDAIFFYANLGVDILRLDAPAFIWKQVDTTSQNLPQVHVLLRIIKHCIELATPGMAILGEAIVAPVEIMKYFGEGDYLGRECDIAYNATMMALQWDALATTKTKVMQSGYFSIMNKPLGSSWINYTRCHDDIGLGFSDDNIKAGGFEPFTHRSFLQKYYTGEFPGSRASGALFSVNPKTHDARISGSLASLCGLEKVIASDNRVEVNQAISKIILMQAQTFFIGGIPMLFYGDEAGYTNDYSFLEDPGKSYDNRWMHRPVIHWEKNQKTKEANTIESKIFEATRRLISIRKKYPVIADHNNFHWLRQENFHLCSFVRANNHSTFFVILNYDTNPVYVSWYLFKEFAQAGQEIWDEWNQEILTIGDDEEHLFIPPHGIILGVLK